MPATGSLLTWCRVAYRPTCNVTGSLVLMKAVWELLCREYAVLKKEEMIAQLAGDMSVNYLYFIMSLWVNFLPHYFITTLHYP